jgi:Tfp pilus assembly protein FimT
MNKNRGVTFLEAVVFLALVGLVAAVAVPALGDMRASALTAAGARHLAVTLHALRWKSVAQGRGHGLLFVEAGQGWVWYEVRDGNGNGLRTAEVRAGTDPTLAGPHRLEDVATGVSLGFPPGGPYPRIPPGAGWISRRDDPVRIGNTDLLTFSPVGTASSGTLYVTDGRERLYAVVLYGRTARIRVWRYSEARAQWTS